MSEEIKKEEEIKEEQLVTAELQELTNQVTQGLFKLINDEVNKRQAELQEIRKQTTSQIEYMDSMIRTEEINNLINRINAELNK